MIKTLYNKQSSTEPERCDAYRNCFVSILFSSVESPSAPKADKLTKLTHFPPHSYHCSSSLNNTWCVIPTFSKCIVQQEQNTAFRFTETYRCRFSTSR